MEDLVAIRVTDEVGKLHYFMTWGRVFGPIDQAPLLQAVGSHLAVFGLKNFREIALCDTLRDASDQPYFFEALFDFSRQGIPFGEGYELWEEERRKSIERGKEIYYLGAQR